MQIACRELVLRSYLEISKSELDFMETLHRDSDFAERSYRDLVQRSCQETSHRDLAQGSCMEISYSDLAKRSLQQRPCQETTCRDLAHGPVQRSLAEILPRSLTEILPGEL